MNLLFSKFKDEMLKKIEEEKTLTALELKRLVSDCRCESDLQYEDLGVRIKTIINLKNRYFLIDWAKYENEFEEQVYEFIPQIPEEVFPVNFYVNSKGKILFNLSGVC